MPLIDSDFESNYFVERAINHFINKEYSEAEFFYKRLCYMKPTSNIWLTRGLCFKFMKMYESAVYCFNKSLQIEKSVSETHYHIGSSLLELEKFEIGMDFLDNAMKLSPNSYLPFYMKSIAEKYYSK